MSLEAEERNLMIQLRMERANAFLSEADNNFQVLKMFSTAANRYYYACFHAVSALFVSLGLYPKTHEGINVLFNQHFVKTGLFDTKFGVFLTRMEHLREKADYDVVFTVSETDLQDMKPVAHELIEKIQVYLLNGNNK